MGKTALYAQKTPPPHAELRRPDYGHVVKQVLSNNINWLQPCVICVPALDLLCFQ
jgi:hypothetical protein